MKKLLSVFMLLLVLCTSLSTAVFAVYGEAEIDELDDFCTVIGDFESVEFDGKTYIPFDIEDAYLGGNDYISLKVYFSDSGTEDLYYYTDVYLYGEYPYVLCAGYEDKYYRYEEKFFVEESRYDEVINTVSGQAASGYITESDYSYSVGDFSFKTEQIENWLETDREIKAEAETFSQWRAYPLYASDPGGAIRREIGLILRADTYDGYADTYYLVYYPEYDRSYFYADGTFAIDSDEIATFYPLADETLAKDLSEYYDLLPKDELDWMVDTTMPEELFYALMSVIFVILPIAAIVFAIVVVVKRGDNNPYLPALIVLIVSSSAVIIGYLAVLMHIV